jgi:hypothetical protein
MAAPELIALFGPASRGHSEGGKKSKKLEQTPRGQYWVLRSLESAALGHAFLRRVNRWVYVSVEEVPPPEHLEIWPGMVQGNGERRPARAVIYRGRPMGWDERWRLAQYSPPPNAWGVRSIEQLVSDIDPEGLAWILLKK